MKTTLFTLAIILLSFALQAQKMTLRRVTTKQTSESGTWFALEKAPITARTYYLQTRQASDTYKSFLKSVKTLKAVSGYSIESGKFYKLVVFTNGSDTTKETRDTVKNEIINESK
jgi:hypothetical protein